MSRDDSTDSELLALLTLNDPRALSTFFDRYAPTVTRYAWAIATTKTDVRRHEKDRTEELPDTLRTDPRANDEDREQLRWVLDEIERLDPIDRRICELCLIEGHPYAEAAKQVGISVDAVKKRVSRTRARFRKAVTDHEN